MQPKLESRSKGFFEDLLYGFLIPFRALDLIFSKPKLLFLSLFPVLLSLVVIGLFFYLGFTHLSGWVTGVFQHFFHSGMSSFDGVLIPIILIIAAILLGYCCIQLIGFILNLIAFPLNDLLAQQTENVLGVQRPQDESLSAWARVIFLDIRKTVFGFILLVFCTLGLLIPGLNLLFFIAISVLTTFNFITYPQSRRQIGIAESLRWIHAHFASCLGFGILTGFLFSAPLLNIFALPVAVVGGTMLYFRK